MAARLGLHTKEEREKAYGMASLIYRFSMLKEASRHDVYYALGYVEAVIDLLQQESPDPELMTILVQMRDDLMLKSST